MDRFGRPVIAALLALVFVLGMATFGRREIYPFAPWDMYARTPATMTDFRIVVSRIGERRFDPPVYLQDVPERARATRSVTNANLLRSYGHALLSSDPAGDRYRPMVEQAFGLRDADYKLERIIFNPLDRYREGSIIAASMLETTNESAVP